MSLTSFLAISSSSSFLNGSSTPLVRFSKPSSSPTVLLPIRAMKILEGVVVKTSRDKTVAVEVTRQVQHPKYHRRVRIKKLLHAHDPENKFQIGDLVQLDRTRPISKTKSFLAIPAPPRVSNKDKKSTNEDLGIPLQSQLS